MSFLDHLIHTCSTQRATRPTGVYGQDRPTWNAHLSAVSCRLVIKTQSYIPGIEHEGAVVSSYKLFVPEGTDIKQGDRVDEVTDGEGNSWGPFDIREVLPRRSRRTHHITLSLERSQP